VAEGIQVVCAVAPLNAVDHDVVLPLDVVTDLESMPVVHVMCVTAGSVDINSVAGMNDCDACSSEAVGVNNECLTTNDDVKPIVVHNTDQLMMNDDDHGNEELITAQRGDPSLTHCWEMAQLNKGNFIVDRGILFHVDHVEGERVCQLCVPECKRNSVMQLAHDSVFSGHLAERKTRERIRLSFYWPKLRQYVKQYVATCHDCQLRSRPKTLDRVPITPITRADLPFQVLHMDCVGPINPPSAQGHQYCLCIVDNCTRWPTVYALKSLSARAVCEALLDLFVNVGVPSKIISDNATNFSGQLTQELLLRLGCSPVFVTPGHPQASGLVERFNKTCKDMLHHVIQQHGRQWHRVIPLAVWALREVPNATTGVSPYMLVYGRVPRGPLAVLKDSWTSQRDVKADVGKPVEEYMNDLRCRLKKAADWATLHAQHGQHVYTHNYNLRSRDKHFDEGDKVIVLDDDAAGKLCKRWQGPATVVRVKSPYSYLVDMGDGRVRHVHANKIRKFNVRVQGCNVISESDDDFGRVLVPGDVQSEVMPSVHVDCSKIEHLSNEQRKQLGDLIDEFAVCFSDKPGLCRIAEHRSQVTEGFQPKRMRPYRVPEIMKPEVERQIKDLLDAGLIVRSNSPMASPLVCVAKKQGGVRLACDYRYVNSFTIADAFPLCTIDEMIRKVGRGRYISVFDAKSGYWQFLVYPQDRWLTAFVTHEGLYEWVRMPFGLRNAGATFVRAVTGILQPLQEFSGSYVDDMAVGSEDWSTHLVHLRRFFMTIWAAGLTLNLSKCEFAQPEVRLLGHIVGSGVKKADPQRLGAIAEIPRPTTKRELRRLLGAVGYYREYIPQFAEVAKPLTDLTNKRFSNFILWREEHERAFLTLQQKLCSPPVLALPDIGRPYHLHTDASGYAVAAALGQMHEGKTEKPIAFASQKLSGSQLSWPIIEKEAYAIIWALNRFRDIIFGAHVTIFCDHNPLQYIRECAPKSSKLLRWSLSLQEFDVEIKYTKGAENVVADYLSRM